jgi:hypothetical protein
VADPQIVGQVVVAVAAFLGGGGAAYLGMRAANRNTDVEDRRARETALVEDKRAKETAEWARIHELVKMACSTTNPVESYVGVYLLQRSKDNWRGNADQRAFVKRTLDALNAPAIEAYREGQRKFVTGSSPSAPPPPPPQPGGP